MLISRRPAFATRTTLALAVAGAMAFAAVPAQAQWRGGYHYGYHGRAWLPGAVIGGTLLGLGIGAAVAPMCPRPRSITHRPRPITRRPITRPRLVMCRLVMCRLAMCRLPTPRRAAMPRQDTTRRAKKAR
jgi:hypothetical protein